MFSIKQYIINMTSDDRKELIKLINEIDNGMTSEVIPVDVPIQATTYKNYKL